MTQSTRRLRITFGILTLLLLMVPVGSRAEQESMPSMPKIQPKRTYMVPSREAGEELDAQKGFGEEEPMVRMMNLMMVGGSGYEGMEMDMSGHAHHPMQANASSPPPSTAHAHASHGGASIEARIDPNPPKVGMNRFMIDLKDVKTGKPLTGLKIDTQVAMTSMDMGTETPQAKETKPGSYEVRVPFAMKGPWEVRIKANASDGNAVAEKSFTFNVGSNEAWKP